MGIALGFVLKVENIIEANGSDMTSMSFFPDYTTRVAEKCLNEVRE